MKRILLFVSMMWLSCSAFAQTGTIEGKINDGDSNEGLPGANILIKGTSSGTITDIDGNFRISNLKTGSYVLEISYIGYEIREINTTVTEGQTTDIGTLELAQATVGLKEVEVIASVAIDRRTPVAFSTIGGKKIESKIGNQEFPEILRSTPSVYVTKQGGGFGDSRINVRGFDQRNTAVMINGIPVNDMENGWVYWSNWAGLSDVTSNMQVQRGLGASKLAVASVGGSINIITNAAEMKKGGSASTYIGNDGYQKYGLMLSTGLGDKGWAITFQGTHTRGDGYADGTLFRGWSYFGSIAKQINSKHSLHLTALGAPQWHFQREYGSYDGVTIETIEERGIRYNPQWGYYAQSEYKDNLFSWRKNFYHKPKIFLNHYWSISEKTELATSVYASFRRGGGTGDLGQINGRYRTSGRFKDANGIVAWNDIHAWNTGNPVGNFGDDQVPWSGPGVSEEDPDYSGPFAGQHVAESWRNGMILRSSMNSHNWFGILSNLTTELSEKFTLVSGLDARYYKGIHYRRLENLLGLNAYFDDDDINDPDHYVTKEGNSNGNEIDYYNDGLVNWLGLYTQLEYEINALSAFISLSGSNQGFKRIDYFVYEDSDPQQKSDWENFLGGTVKAGINYNINDQHNVFVNGGYFSRQPIFDNVFINYRNDVNENVKNQTVNAIEFGYGFRTNQFAVNVNIYNTFWGDRQISRSDRLTFYDLVVPDDTVQVEGTTNYNDINQLHQGVELDFKYKPTEKLEINGMLSLANWRYTKDFTGEWVSEDSDHPDLTRDLTLYMKDVKVPDAAQTTISIDATYEIIKDLKISGVYYYADRVYSDYDISTDKTFFEPGKQGWKLPSYSLVDANLFYNFNLFDLDMSFRLNINNLFDTKYISESETTILYDPTNETDIQYGEYGNNGSVRNIAYYGFGRTWNAGLKVKF